MYLDNNSTTHPSPGAREAMLRAVEDDWANPSSVHRAGQRARRQVDLARADVARLIGASAKDLIFTSGGTESIALAIRGLNSRRRDATPPTILTTRIEHSAVLECLEGLHSEGLIAPAFSDVTPDGLIDLDSLVHMLDELRPSLVCAQWINNETGAIQPIEAIFEACRTRGVVLHCDAVQCAGKMPIVHPPCDLLSISAHKFHGPKGVGALWVRPGVHLEPILHGAQELGRRGGTENVPGILAAGAAARDAIAWLDDPAARSHLAAMRGAFEQHILRATPGSRIIGPRDSDRRIWNTTNIAFPGIEAQALLMLLSERGVFASAGAACSSGSIEPSPVLLAMGLDAELAQSAVRFSLSRDTTRDELNEAADIIIASVRRLRSAAHAGARDTGEAMRHG